MEQLLIVLSVLVVFLTILTSIVLVLIIGALFALRQTLLRLQRAITNVEDTAVRSLAPFVSLRSLFADTNGFVHALQSLFKAVSQKKR